MISTRVRVTGRIVIAPACTVPSRTNNFFLGRRSSERETRARNFRATARKLRGPRTRKSSRCTVAAFLFFFIFYARVNAKFMHAFGAVIREIQTTPEETCTRANTEEDDKFPRIIRPTYSRGEGCKNLLAKYYCVRSLVNRR